MQISLNNVSKFYKVFEKPQDLINQFIIEKTPILNANTKKLYRKSWALQNIDLNIKKGETLGIVGKNGSGKSTLLQIIAGTVSASSGYVRTKGRITSLIELGSGFNNEFTGEDNVILNGLILGLSRKEVLEKYDEIISFADIGEYINLPVKTYSTGMLMRLAFSVQTSLNPDILIVDEAISVGDIFFQAKCINRMKKLRDMGVTILFVSHSMASINELCDRSILLEKGIIKKSGNTSSVTDCFILSSHNLQDIQDNKIIKNIENEKDLIKNQKSLSKKAEESVLDSLKIDHKNFIRRTLKDKLSKGFTEIQGMNIFDEHNNFSKDNIFNFNQKIKILVVISFLKDLNNINLTIKIRTKTGIDLIHIDTFRLLKEKKSYKKGRYIFECRMCLPLQHGEYLISLLVSKLKDGSTNNAEIIEFIGEAGRLMMNPIAKGMIGGYLGLDALLNVKRI